MKLTETRGLSWHELADRVLNGEAASHRQALAVLNAPHTALLDLLAAAYRIRHHYFGNYVKLNFLINAQSGICPEDCHYCSQSRDSSADIPRYSLLSCDDIVEKAQRAVELRATTCCIVLSGRGPSERELDHVAEATQRIRARFPGLRVCACMGLLTEAEADVLKQAGVDRYNHNLNTANAFYDQICTTHTYEDRIATVEAVGSAGISPCSGMIVGMGESLEDIVEVSFSLRAIGADSIPVNFLVPIEGTPLENGATHLDPVFCLKVLCAVRFICPDREIRVSAGREVHLRALQPLSLYPANAIFIADYLTTAGQEPGLDWHMIEDLGFVIESTDGASAAPAASSRPCSRS